MPSQYRPGTQRKSVGRYRISPNRIAWARTAITQLALMRYSDDEMKKVEKRLPGDEGEIGDTLRLMISTTSGRPYTLNLTAMTEEELNAFERLITFALRLARPIVQERDREAAKRYESGDDSFSRSYRQLPQLLIRKGAFSADDQGVLDGFEDVVTGPTSRRAPESAVRGGRPPVADEVQEDCESEDNEQTLDEPESLHQMGTMEPDAGGLLGSDSSESDSSPSS